MDPEVLDSRDGLEPSISVGTLAMEQHHLLERLERGALLHQPVELNHVVEHHGSINGSLGDVLPTRQKYNNKKVSDSPEIREWQL